MPTTTTITPILPKDVVPGMIIRINVPTSEFRTDFDCEVLEVKKVRRNETTQYAVTIKEPEVPGRHGKSTRYFQPRDRVDLVHYEFTTLLRTWSGIAWYGAVFNDEEDAKLWAKLEARGGRWDVMQQENDEWHARVHH
jgi:hypothetical protein